MEQSNQLNENLKQIKGMLGFLNPSTSFIVNAAFAVVAFVLFIMNDACIITTEKGAMAIFGGGYPKMITAFFQGIGGILGFLVLLGLIAGTILVPMKKQRLSVCLNFFVGGFMLLTSLAYIRWNIITILMVIIVLLPWMLFTYLKKDDEIKL